MKSIQQEKGFVTVVLKVPESVFDGKDFAEVMMGFHKALEKSGCQWMGEVLTQLDEEIRKTDRIAGWEVSKKREKSIVTSMGEVKYSRTMYRNRFAAGETDVPLDRLLGIKAHEHMTEDAKAVILEHAQKSSYAWSGLQLGGGEQVSKQTVMELIHGLAFPTEAEQEKPEEKKKVTNLYIEADEGHCSRQDEDEEGKRPVLQPKLVYVHEGKRKNAEGKWELIHPHYFGGLYTGEAGNAALWEEAFTYANRTYNIEKLENLYLNSDGGAWIRSAHSVFRKVRQVMDGFHLEEYLTRLVSFYEKEDRKDTKAALQTLLKEDKQEAFRTGVERVRKDAERAGALTENREKMIGAVLTFFENNWETCRRRLLKEAGVLGSTTEGHVYHVYSSRMSCLAMSWNETGADCMARLRVYKWNGNSMIDLVRYQRKIEEPELAKAVGCEDIFTGKGLTLAEVMKSEKRHHGELGRNYDVFHHDVCDSIRHSEWFKGLVIGGKKL